MEMELEIPGGLTDLLQEFTYQVLSEKPDDIVEFAANYFMKLKIKEKRSKDGAKKKSRGVSFHAEENGGDNSDDEDDEEDIGIYCVEVNQSSFWSSELSDNEVPKLRKDFKNSPGVYFISSLLFLLIWLLSH